MSEASPRLRLAPLPHPTAPGRNRRRYRPEGTHDALMCALSASADRAGMDALLLADERGFLVSRSATHLDLAELAAIAPIVARKRARAQIRRNGRERVLDVRPIQVAGETLYVVGLGECPERCAKSVVEGARAAVRILAA